MKKIFRKKNILLFFLIYGILTVFVSLFHLISGTSTDPLGYWHEIYRFFFVLILMLLYDFIRNLSFRKNWKSFLEQLIPLLLALAGFVAILYLKGDIGLNRIRDLILYFLGILIGFLLLRAIFHSLREWFRNLFNGRKKIYFSFLSLLLLLILILPAAIYLLFISAPVVKKIAGYWYLAAAGTGGLVLIGLLLSQNQSDEFDPLTVILILTYYVLWFLIGYNGKGLLLILLVQLTGCCILLAYENRNEFHHCVSLTMLMALLLSIAAYLN